MRTLGHSAKRSTCVGFLVTWCIASVHALYQDCKGVPLCGVLALESGFGSRNYLHPDPVVHGLWPQVAPYGNSQCLAPKQSTVTREKHYCYKPAGKRQSWFENHEWTKHGICAGAQNDDHFFDQVCDLSDEPLALMNRVRDERTGPCNKQRSESGQEACFLKIIREVKKKFPVFSVDQYNDQIMLSACAGYNGIWKLASTSDFQKMCGAGSAPVLTPAGKKAVCYPHRSSPKCHRNSDCTHLSGCVRCAKSGRCTHIPYTSSSKKAVCYPHRSGPKCHRNSDCTHLSGCVRCAKWGRCTHIPYTSSSKKVVCYPMRSGPKCHRNSDCTHLSGCVRCAKSGKCTHIPSALRLVEEPDGDATAFFSLGGKRIAWRAPLLLVGLAVLVSASLIASRVQSCSRRWVEEMPVDCRQAPDAEGLLS